MSYSKTSGFTLVEMILVCAITCIIIAIGGIAWQRASVNRKLDATISAFESTLVLARQTAQNRQGAKLTFTLPNQEADGKWELCPTGTSETITIGTIPRCLSVSVDPSSNTAVEFNAAGSVKADSTQLNSEGNVNFTFTAIGYDRSTTLALIGMTGAVVKK